MDKNNGISTDRQKYLNARLEAIGFTISDSGCWEWDGAIGGHGYGNLRIDGKVTYAHRVAYEAWVGPIPEGKHVLHSCDNTLCIRPSHLRAGTNRDNALDAVERGRHTKRYGITPDTVEGVRRRRAEGASQSALAAEFGISQAHVGRIVRGECRA